MKVQLRRWSVPAGVIDLKTRRAPEGLDFFVSPPPEIGRVKSVVWDVRAGQALWALWFKILLASLVTVLALTALLWLRSQKKLGEKAGLPEVMLLGIAHRHRKQASRRAQRHDGMANDLFWRKQEAVAQLAVFVASHRWQKHPDEAHPLPHLPRDLRRLERRANGEADAEMMGTLDWPPPALLNFARPHS